MGSARTTGCTFAWDVLREHDGPMLRWGLQEMDRKELWVPGREEQRPNREFLAERFGRFRAA